MKQCNHPLQDIFDILIFLPILTWEVSGFIHYIAFYQTLVCKLYGECLRHTRPIGKALIFIFKNHKKFWLAAFRSKLKF